MRPGAGNWLNLLAAAVAAVLLPGAAGKSAFFRATAQERGFSAARFHDHKQKAEGITEPACAGKECHASSSHRKGGSAAFLNMHEGNVSCLACHGKEFEKRWTVSLPGGDRAARLSYSPGDRAGGHHDALGGPATCEHCHSESGKEIIAAAGWKEIPQGFVSPIPMRMLQGGGRKWLPDDAR
jgi:hypothetical protein